MKVLVAGAGGFIGGHLVARLLKDGHIVRAVDLKPLELWFQKFSQAENCPSVNLELEETCNFAVKEIDWVFNLACDMGGIGYITQNKMACMFSVLINTNLLRASIKQNCQKYFFSSTACVYNTDLQGQGGLVFLKESDVCPAKPESGYGWEKLFSEKLCVEVGLAGRIDTKIARLHNVYGPYGSYADGKEKFPAAICRKFVEAKIYGNNQIDIWGDGNQIRSFMYIDDCIDGIIKIMNSNISDPINLGSSDCLSINQVIDILQKKLDTKLSVVYKKNQPIGVLSRSSDNTMIRSCLNWEPTIKIDYGIQKTYEWIYDEIVRNLK